MIVKSWWGSVRDIALARSDQQRGEGVHDDDEQRV